MRYSVTIRIAEKHKVLAVAAAEWAQSAHRDVDATASIDVVVLASGINNPFNLEAIWAAALANEVEHQRHKERRAATISRLFA